MGSEANNNNVPFYMKQTGTLDNACGIIACIHATLNNLDKIELTADSTLAKFQHVSKEISPADRATALENDAEFRNYHKGYAAQG